MSDELQAYCVKCKEKRTIASPEPVFTKSAQPATRGECPVCGTSLYRMGETPAHDGMERPEPAPRNPAKKKKTKAKSKRSRNSSKKKNGGSPRRRGKLVIVESPAKARTIENYLGSDYKVMASVGHVRDLLKSQLSVDVENDFEPKYRVPNDKRQVVKDLIAAAERAKEVYLATDPDREGEAIAWHLLESADLEEERTQRVVFYEVTRDAVRDAFENPRQIDMNLVNAQQTRRILDRLVGYELSPLLWQKVRPRLSAGRVQSVAVRLIVERERDIENFDPEEYWTIDAELARQADAANADRMRFTARLFKINGEDPVLPDEETVTPLVAELEASRYDVTKVKRGQRRRNPSAPFITSTIQQEASRRLGFNASKTMRIAQQLYEGVDFGKGDVTGLITYMRTDSTNVSDKAREEAAQYITDTYGTEYLPEKPNRFGKRSKNAQEAHEAIRPTSVMRTPSTVKSFLTRDQYQLYLLTWQRFVASQMTAAIYDTLRVEIMAGDASIAPKKRPYEFRATGSTLRFPGFLAVYGDFSNEDDPEGSDLGRIFPELTDNDLLDLLALIPEQHFTQPPPRYTEATLVRTLEELGIGRPSTYAPIINTVQQRGYVTREGKMLIPTDTGAIVNDLLVAHFPEIVDTTFTARMEGELDQIASGEQDWVPLLREFYDPFKAEVEHAREHVPNVDLGVEEVGRECPKCGEPLVIKWGRYGKFIGCSNFPTCRHTEPWLEYIGVTCPECREGEIVERKTRKGRTFYGCSRYPECEYTSWKRPLPDACPNCGQHRLVIQSRRTVICEACETRHELNQLPSVREAEGV